MPADALRRVAEPETATLTLPDGIELVADLWRPAGPGRHPVLLMRQPYGRAIASTLTLAGNPAGAYSLPLIKAVVQAVSGWDPPSVAPYPPTFLLLILPLALMPYQLSLAVWQGLTLGGYLLLMRRIAPHPLTPWLFLGFPAIFLNISYGQNGLLSTVLLGGGLLLA